MQFDESGASASLKLLFLLNAAHFCYFTFFCFARLTLISTWTSQFSPPLSTQSGVSASGSSQLTKEEHDLPHPSYFMASCFPSFIDTIHLSRVYLSTPVYCSLEGLFKFTGDIGQVNQTPVSGLHRAHMSTADSSSRNADESETSLVTH